MKLWRKLVKVHADLQTLSYTMHSYNFVSRSVEFLIEALQEQVNYRHTLQKITRYKKNATTRAKSTSTLRALRDPRDLLSTMND
jgi:hypothetical protein